MQLHEFSGFYSYLYIYLNPRYRSHSLQSHSLPPPLLQPFQRPVQPEMLDAAALMKIYTTDLEDRVREGGAAFGRLDVLARRKSARVQVKQNQPCSTSLSHQPCSTPPGAGWVTSSTSGHSRQWLLTHRAHCGGSPLRPSAPGATQPRWLGSAPSPGPAPEARTGLTLTTEGTRTGSVSAAARSESAAGAEKPPPKQDEASAPEGAQDGAHKRLST